MSCRASWSARRVTVQVLTTISPGSLAPGGDSESPAARSRFLSAAVSYWFRRQPRVQKETRGAMEDPSGADALASLISHQNSVAASPASSASTPTVSSAAGSAPDSAPDSGDG